MSDRTWPGGVRTVGGLLVIPGRTLDVDQLAEAEQHARSVLAAVGHLTEQTGAPWCRIGTRPIGHWPTAHRLYDLGLARDERLFVTACGVSAPNVDPTLAGVEQPRCQRCVTARPRGCEPVRPTPRQPVAVDLDSVAATG